MVRQLARHIRSAPSCKVRWRTGHGHSKGWADAHGDHVLVNVIAHPYAGIEALGCDVRKRVVHAEFNADIWILAQQRSQPLPKNGYEGMQIAQISLWHW